MTLHTPLWMQAGLGDPEIEYPAQADRLTWGMIFNAAGVGNTAADGDLKVVQRGAGANFSVDVGAGVAIILGTDVAGQGFYAVWLDATENLVIPAPPVSGTRIHRVVARIRDKLHDGTQTTYDWVLEVLEDPDGTGPPAIPDSAISLATVTVTSATVSITTANIADTRQNAAVGSGMVRANGTASDTDRPANPWASELIWREDRANLEVYDGSAWRDIVHRDGGGSEWTTYTPSLTATTSNPTLGTGSTVSGRYMRMGRTVIARAIVVFGTSGTGAGSGFYEITLPVAARTTTPGRQIIGSAYARNNPVADFFDGSALLEPAVGNRVRISINSDVVTEGVPFAWSVGDEIGFTVTYEAAS